MEKEIYFHTGLSKTASTFLQHRVFPKLQGIYYLPTTKYRSVYRLLPKKKAAKILVSREFDQQFAQEVHRFSSAYPKAKPIVVFREPTAWVYSQYKRFVKNGYPFTFRQFIDIEKDQGHFKKQDLAYAEKIHLLEEAFGTAPLVLNYEELKVDNCSFVQRIADYTGTEIELSSVNFRPKHKSYSDKSVKLIRPVNSFVSFTKKPKNENIPFNYLYNVYANSMRYTVLYGGKLVPSTFVPKAPLIQEEELEAIRSYTQEDWDFVLNYIAKQNHVHATR